VQRAQEVEFVESDQEVDFVELLLQETVESSVLSRVEAASNMFG
jgi:hypothetical protein